MWSPFDQKSVLFFCFLAGPVEEQEEKLAATQHRQPVPAESTKQLLHICISDAFLQLSLLGRLSEGRFKPARLDQPISGPAAPGAWRDQPGQEELAGASQGVQQGERLGEAPAAPQKRLQLLQQQHSAVPEPSPRLEAASSFAGSLEPSSSAFGAAEERLLLLHQHQSSALPEPSPWLERASSFTGSHERASPRLFGLVQRTVTVLHEPLVSSPRLTLPRSS